VESSSIRTVSHALILQVTFSTLVADGTIERVVGEQELHDTFSCFVNEWGIRLDSHAGLHRPSAGGNRLWRSLDFDKTHTAVTGDHKLFMVAVSRDGGAGFFASLDEC